MLLNPDVTNYLAAQNIEISYAENENISNNDTLVLDIGTTDNINNEYYVGVVYSFTKNKYIIFHKYQTFKLIKFLNSADKIIGFNIIKFDYCKILLKIPEYGLTWSQFQQLQPKTIDIFAILKKDGFIYKLDSLANTNLDRRKLLIGREIFNGEEANSIITCIDDVYITKQLFHLWQNNTLKLPSFKPSSILKDEIDYWEYNPIFNITNCFYCQSKDIIFDTTSFISYCFYFGEKKQYLYFEDIEL